MKENSQMFEHYKNLILEGKMSREELNNMHGQVSDCLWSWLRGVWNDKCSDENEKFKDDVKELLQEIKKENEKNSELLKKISNNELEHIQSSLDNNAELIGKLTKLIIELKNGH